MSRKLLFLCAIISIVHLVCSQSTEDEGIIRIPLAHTETGLEKLLNRGADLKVIEGIYDMQRRSYSKLKKEARLTKEGKPPKPIPTNDTLPLFKYMDTQYYGIVNIGKPGRPFKMIMDTAWGYSWVPSKDCPKTRLPCAVHEKYDHNRSSTYKEDGRKFNMSNQFIGYMSNDVFLVGQMNATNQVFAELTGIPWIFALYDSDGTIGLGFPQLSPHVTPFFYNLLSQNQLKEPIFSFYINRDPTTPRGGSLFFGGIDYKHNKTEFTTINITSTRYWEFDMNKVSVVISKKSHVDFCQSGCKALADTSSNTIVGPAEEIKEINRLIGAETTFFSNRYLIPCNNEYKAPKINFTINNQSFQIKPRDYIQKITYSGFMVCLSAFQPAEDDSEKNMWSLGGAFLYQFYTAYDVKNHKLMIAEAA